MQKKILVICCVLYVWVKNNLTVPYQAPQSTFSRVSAEKFRYLVKLCDDGNIPAPFQNELSMILPHSPRQLDIQTPSDIEDPKENEDKYSLFIRSCNVK